MAGLIGRGGLDMATTLRWHGDNMTTTSRRHDGDMATTWQRHGDDMATMPATSPPHWLLQLPQEFLPTRPYWQKQGHSATDVAAMWWRCGGNVAAMCRRCGGNVSSLPCRHHVVFTSSSCRRRVVAMSSSLRRHVVVTSSACRHHALAMSSPCRRWCGCFVAFNLRVLANRGLWALANFFPKSISDARFLSRRWNHDKQMQYNNDTIASTTALLIIQ